MDAAIVRREPDRSVMSNDEIDRTYRVAKALALSGMFKDARQAEQAFAKIVLGRELGLNAAQSMTGIYIVEGKPQVSGTMLASFIKQHPNYDYTVVEHTDEVCELEFWELLPDGGERTRTSRFTMEDAKRAGVANKDVWKKYPRNMLFARAMSNGVKWFAPDATNGVTVYVEGEIEERPSVTAAVGEGTDDGTGVDLGERVEAILARATELGHAALSKRGNAEIALGGREPDYIDAWCDRQDAVLDQFEVEKEEKEAAERAAAAARSEIADADVVQEATQPTEVTILRDRLDRLNAQLPDADEGSVGDMNAEINMIEAKLAQLEGEK